MKLKIYMVMNKLTCVQIAEMADMHKETIRAYARGITRISRRAAKAISQATKGALSVEDLLADNPPMGRYAAMREAEK